MGSPSRVHQGLVRELSYEIQAYIKKNEGSCKVYPAPFSVRLNNDDANMVEPDISVICDPDKLTEQGCTGAPDWIIEVVSPSDKGHDYITKLSKYYSAGVREYWIVDPLEKCVFVYRLSNFFRNSIIVLDQASSLLIGVSGDSRISESISLIDSESHNFSDDRCVPEKHTFEDRIQAGIYDDLIIDFKEIVSEI